MSAGWVDAIRPRGRHGRGSCPRLMRDRSRSSDRAARPGSPRTRRPMERTSPSQACTEEGSGSDVKLTAEARSTRDPGRAIAYSGQLVFWLNGSKVVLDDPDPSIMLVDYLHGVGLVGTKVGCGQGGCGACTVMLSHRDVVTGNPVHRALNSCLRPLCAVDGLMVTTIEGIGSVRAGLDPVQHCIAANNGTQCGFCTPGFVMNAHAFLQQNPAPTERELEDIFGGNLCRCTGYRPLLHGMRTQI